MKSAQLPTRRSWRSLFSRSRADDEYFYDSKLSAPRAFYGYQGLMSWSKSASGKDLFVLRYSRLYCSGLDCPFDGLSEWREIDVFLRDFGIEQRCFESSSPANATKYTVVYDFLDGDLKPWEALISVGQRAPASWVSRLFASSASVLASHNPAGSKAKPLCRRERIWNWKF
jgi:hypothetical protein